ncbi:MAG: hypothetical protein MZU91_07690 [Desulfosudis oleivorans]|nr:hypothetical protein [Desulfosudis oleivorans]
MWPSPAASASRLAVLLAARRPGSTPSSWPITSGRARRRAGLGRAVLRFPDRAVPAHVDRASSPMSKAHVHTIIKNFPLGLGSLIVYGLRRWRCGYPRLGMGWGTVAAFAAATACTCSSTARSSADCAGRARSYLSLGEFVQTRHNRKEGPAWMRICCSLIDTAIAPRGGCLRLLHGAFAARRTGRRPRARTPFSGWPGGGAAPGVSRPATARASHGAGRAAAERCGRTTRIAEHHGASRSAPAHMSSAEVFLTAAHRELRSHLFLRRAGRPASRPGTSGTCCSRWPTRS